MILPITLLPFNEIGKPFKNREFTRIYSLTVKGLTFHRFLLIALWKLLPHHLNKRLAVFMQYKTVPSVSFPPHLPVCHFHHCYATEAFSILKPSFLLIFLPNHTYKIIFHHHQINFTDSNLQIEPEIEESQIKTLSATGRVYLVLVPF